MCARIRSTSVPGLQKSEGVKPLQLEEQML